MMMTMGTVVDGKIVVDGEPLEEGSTVTILAPSGEDETGFELGPDEEAALLESIQQADRGEVISAEDLLRDLGATD
jgi:hypothetical protein